MGGVGGAEEIKPIFGLFLSNDPSKKGRITFGGDEVEKYSKAGSTDKDLFWADMAHKKTYFWTLNMGDTQFADGNKLAVESKHVILDSGLSYSLIPSEDFKILTQTLEKSYGVKCAAGEKKDNFSA